VVLIAVGALLGLGAALYILQPSQEVIHSVSSADSADTQSGLDENYRYNIAYVKPVFTDTAYQDYGFYDFYEKYANADEVTADHEWLKVPIYERTIPNRLANFFDHLRSLNNNGTDVSIISDLDIDVYDGNLLLEGNNGTKFDAVMIGHQEYVSQREYDALKEYVSKGGVLIILNGNVFYAEVYYDKGDKTLQLVKGHNWEFDGKVAKKSVAERWAEETSLWTGGNYLCGQCEIAFDNNPFDYGHVEEQHVTNPDVKIIMDYGARFEGVSDSDITIATYSLDYGEGKVIVMGMYAEYVVKNPDFRDFFSGLLEEYVFE
jgi:hypothetical protein